MGTNTIVRRTTDWRLKLSNFIVSHRLLDFDRATHDCVRFSADAVMAMTGVDLAEGIRDKYHDDLSAAKYMKRSGGFLKIMEEQMARFGIEEIDVSRAKRGDLCYFHILEDGKGHEALAVSNGLFSITPGKHGLVQLTTSKANKVWSIPF